MKKLSTVLASSGVLILSHPAHAETMQYSSDTNAVNISASVDGVAKKFVLDTGNVMTMVAPDKQTLAFKTVSTEKTFGAANVQESCDVVVVPSLKVDTHAFNNVDAERCPAGHGGVNNLGIDALDGLVFSMNFSKSQFSILNTPPGGETYSSLERSGEGHIELPVEVDGFQSYALFDSGWSITAIDSRFIDEHRNLFTPYKNPQWANFDYDIDGNKVMVSYYTVRDLKIGAADFGPQIVMAYKIPDDMEEVLGDNAFVVIGGNTMSTANWIFDLKNNTWAVSGISKGH
jgi:predicted aspartyl protease